MTIHHATQKRATQAGVVLTEPKDGVFVAHHARTNTRHGGTNAKDVLDDLLARVLLKDSYKRFVLSHDEPTDTHIVSWKGDTLAAAPTIREAIAKAVEAWKTAMADQDQEEAEDLANEEDDEDRPHSVVPEHYKALYAARGNPACCGDWLAEMLNEEVLNGDGKLVVDRLIEIADANGVACRQYCPEYGGKSSNGWQGRMRMTTRNLLKPKVAIAGKLVVPGGRDRIAPEDWVEANLPKKVRIARNEEKAEIAKQAE